MSPEGQIGRWLTSMCTAILVIDSLLFQAARISAVWKYAGGGLGQRDAATSGQCRRLKMCHVPGGHSSCHDARPQTHRHRGTRPHHQGRLINTNGQCQCQLPMPMPYDIPISTSVALYQYQCNEYCKSDRTCDSQKGRRLSRAEPGLLVAR